VTSEQGFLFTCRITPIRKKQRNYLWIYKQ
jgi:hypothetical protein